MGGGFLLISPPFRMSVFGAIGMVVLKMQMYSPFSWAGLAIVLLGSAAYSLYSPPRPH